MVAEGKHTGRPLLSGPTLMCLATEDSEGQTTPLLPFASVYMRTLQNKHLSGLWQELGALHYQHFIFPSRSEPSQGTSASPLKSWRIFTWCLR